MSRGFSREALLQALIDEIRAGQRATELVDEAACRLMGINRTDGRCLDMPNLPADQIHAGKFNSPHGMAVAANGDLYVGEWIVGGRITKLARV